MQTNIVLNKKRDSGSFGAIWIAHQTNINRECAVKFIQSDMQPHSDAKQHATALAKVNHPNVVQLYSLEEIENPETSQVEEAIVMELLKGSDLDSLISDSSFTASEAQSFSTELLDAITALHENGVVHGDLHAGNVFVTENKKIKVIDLLLTDTRHLSQLTSGATQSLIKSDIQALQSLLRRIFNNSDISDIFADQDTYFRRCASVDEIREFLSDLTEPKAVIRTAAQVESPAPSETDIQQYEGEVKVLFDSDIAANITSRGYWTFSIRPVDYQKRRTQRILDVKEKFVTAALHANLNFEYDKIIIGEEWINYEFELVPYIQSYKVFRSGQLSGLKAFDFDWHREAPMLASSRFRAGKQIAYNSVMLDIGKFTQLGKAYAKTFDANTPFQLIIKAYHLRDRILERESPNLRPKQIKIDSLTLCDTVKIGSELLLDKYEIAHSAASELLQRFDTDISEMEFVTVLKRFQNH